MYREVEEGIILVNKPEGVTSFGLLGLLKKKLSSKGSTPDSTIQKSKIGHAGTLDPMASGLMIVGLNSGTKKLGAYVGLDKTYEAEILLGVQTDSGDITGEVVAETQSVSATYADISAALSAMVGTLRLPVSKYSAMKQGGEPLYKKVRKGKKFVIPFRDMEVRSVSDIAYNTKEKVVSVTFEVGSGTYVRSLAEDLGRRLNVPATLKKLRRTKVGEFNIQDEKVVTVEAL